MYYVVATLSSVLTRLRAPHLLYILRCVYARWFAANKRHKLLCCDVTNEKYSADHYFVHTYGT